MVTPEEIYEEALAVLDGPPADGDPRPQFRRLGIRGLLAPMWPVEYGGRGLGPHHGAAVVRALVAAGVPETLHTLSVQICGNFLLNAGSRAQRATVLPALARGESFCTVLYSEPEVGSDLAALTTRAEPAPEGGWRLTGRKVYSVTTQYADLGLVAARTSEHANRYQGIGLFLVSLTEPGVDVRLLASIADEDFADVRLTGVHVDEQAVVGPADGAWPLITEALALERTGVEHHAKARTWLGLWRSAAGAAREDPGVRVEEARLETSEAASLALVERCLDEQARGRVDPVLAATTKLYCSGTAQAVARWCWEHLGPAGLEPTTSALRRLEAAYREAPGLTISAGTSEMMLELVAASGLPALDGDIAGPVDEPLARRLRRGVRALADDRDDAEEWWRELARIEVFSLAVPVGHGGLGLGLAASVIACEELGRAAADHGVLDALTTADVLAEGPEAGEEDTARLKRLLAGEPMADLGDTRAVSPPVSPAVLARDRVRRAAWLTGLAVGAIARTVERARTRRQFGRTLIENQDVAFSLARLVARAVAARLLVARTAERLDDPATGGGVRAHPAGVLALAGELAYAATREAVQLHGAYGMTEGSPAARYYRAATTACGRAGPVRELWAVAAAGRPHA